MKNIEEPKIENDIIPDEEAKENQVDGGLLDETNKYGDSYVPNIRIDTKPSARLDATPPAPKKKGMDGAILIVLQWLSYALWGITIVAMSSLAAATLGFYITGSNVGDVLLYGLAAMLVLLPISVVCDIFYIKHEPEEKTRISSFVMAIHAVLFALISIGSLITVAFSAVSLLIGSSNHDEILVTLYTSIIVTTLFVLLFLRTVLPKKYSRIRYFFVAIMIISVLSVCAFGIFGPAADSLAKKNDKLIENNLYSVNEAIKSYASNNEKLPDNLGSLRLKGDAKKLVTDNLVRYKKDSAPSTSYSSSYYSSFYYQLCVDYKKASTEDYPSYPAIDSASDNASSSSVEPTSGIDYVSSRDYYSTYLSTTPHPAGQKCYKLRTYKYNDVIPMSEDTKL